MERRKKSGLIIGTIVLVVAVAMLSVTLVLRSERFQKFAIGEITASADQATGGRTEIRSLDFRLSTLTAHLYGITIHGREPASAPPLLQADKLTVGFKIQSVLQRRINLSDLEIAHPVVHIEVDRDGNSNLPQPPASPTSSPTNIFEMAVHHVLLTNGEINYNDKHVPMDADLYDLGANIHYDLLGGRYSGAISYDRGHLQYRKYAPLLHSFHATFEATPSGLSIDPAVLTVQSSSATLHIRLTNYNHPDVDGNYHIDIRAADFATMATGLKPTGNLVLTGDFRCPLAGAQPLLRVLAVNGDISSDVLSATASTGRIVARKLHGNYSLANGALQATEIKMQTLGGTIRAELDVQHLDATPSTTLRTSFRGISLQAAQQALQRPEVKQVAVFGTLDGESHASWRGGGIQTIKVSSDFTVRGGARPTNVNTASVSVTVDGVIHLTYDGARSAIGFRSSILRIPSAKITAQGEISNHSNLQIHTTVSDLHQVVALVAALRTNSPPPAASGTATFDETIRGSLKRPEIAGDFTAENLKVQGSEWSSARASFKLESSQLAISSATLVSAHRGRAVFSATVALQDWSYLPSNPVKANLSVQRMSIAELEHLANTAYPLDGDLSAQIALSGSQNRPQGSGTAQIANGTAYGESIHSVAVKFKADGNSIHSTVNVALPAGAADADLTFVPGSRTYSFRVDASAVILQRLNLIQAKNLPLSGTFSASASGSGTLDNPQLSAMIQVPKLTLRDKSISNIQARFQVANHEAGFNLNSQVLDSSVQAHGEVNLTGDYYANASIDTASVPLDMLFATYVPNLPEGFRGQTEFHATLKGPLKDRSQLEAHLTIPVLNATYSSLQIGAAAPIRVDYARSRLTIQSCDIRGTDTSLHLQGSIPLAGNSVPTFTAQGSIDVKIARVFLPDTESSGIINLDIHASGTPQHPTVNGHVRLQNVAVSQSGAPLGVENLNGTLNIDNDRINITGLTGQVGGGTLSAGGSVTYTPSLQFNVALRAHSIRLRYPEGLRSLLDGNLALTGTKDSSVLNGRILIDSLSFTSDFDLSKFADQFSSEAATPAQPGLADTVQLSIALQSQDNLSATSSQISMAGRVNLNVSGTAANPVITGRTDLTSGELFYRNVRYQLQRGIITFDDPNETAPVLNVSVTSTVEQYNLTLNLRGPFDKLTTSYVSDPPLATADIINLLATGQTTQQSAGSQSTDSIIASQAASQFSGGVQRLAGLSSLQINPLMSSSNQNPSAQIAIQQRVTKNFLFTFSTDVSQPGTEVVEGDYQIDKRWSVSVARQEAGGVSAEARFHTRF
jgi:translocation and assembly module TamB